MYNYYMYNVLYVQFTLFQTKRLQSLGTCISNSTWDPSQKAITKRQIVEEQLDVSVLEVI